MDVDIRTGDAELRHSGPQGKERMKEKKRLEAEAKALRPGGVAMEFQAN